ncbi:MAG: hypothetical protein JXB26_13270 [Candidatus Aminicenantes bacterium]|nr:hypothetical protein [Candidatus Aminicenantes bacterium]
MMVSNIKRSTTKKSLLSGVLILIFSGYSLGQKPLSCQSLFPRGISLEYGLGRYSVRDEYISKEKYEGNLPFLGVNWSRFHEKYAYSLTLEYRNSSKIKNYNVSADIYQFSLGQEFLYPLAKIPLFKKNLYLSLGPSTDLFFYYNKQNIAYEGSDYSFSFAALFSLGVHSEAIYPIGKHFQAEGFFRLGVLSLGLRTVDMEKGEESLVKLLTLFSGTNTSIRLGIRYLIFDHLSLRLAYKLEMTRIKAWEPLLSASDNLILTLLLHF